MRLWSLIVFAMLLVVRSVHAQAADLGVSMILWSEPGKTRTLFIDPVYPQYGNNSAWQIRIKLEHPKVDKDHTHEVRVRISDAGGQVLQEFVAPVIVKAGQEWHRKDLKEVANLGATDLLRTGKWPLGKYSIEACVDGQPVRNVQFAFVRPIDFPTSGRVYVKNLTGEGVRVVWGTGDSAKHIYVAPNDATFITDTSGERIVFEKDQLFTIRGRTGRLDEIAQWSEARDGSCYWKMTIGGAAQGEDP